MLYVTLGYLFIEHHSLKLQDRNYNQYCDIAVSFPLNHGNGKRGGTKVQPTTLNSLYSLMSEAWPHFVDLKNILLLSSHCVVSISDHF